MAEDVNSEIVKQVLDIGFGPVNANIKAHKQNGAKIPFDGIAALGVCLASISEVIRTAAQALTTLNNGSLQAFDESGSLVDINALS